VAITPAGDAVMVWLRGLEEDEDGEWQMQVRRRSASGVLGPIRKVAGSRYGVVDARVAVDADGDAILAWAILDGTNYRIQARTFSAAGQSGEAGRDKGVKC
jgi:hypothetical protein